MRLAPADDTASIVSIVLDDSDDNTSVKSLQVEVGEEDIDVNISDNSVGGTVEITSEESRSSGDAEVISKEIAVNIKDTGVDLENPVKSPTIIEESTLENKDILGKEKIEEPLNKDNSQTDVPNVLESSTGDVLATTDDVSEMLMDFNDEINDS